MDASARGPTDREGAVPRFIVLEGPPGCSSREVRRLRAEGTSVVAGFRASTLPGREVVCHGPVASGSDAAEALLAALAGHRLLVEARVDAATLDRLVGDLRHLGTVDQRRIDDSPADGLDAESRAVIALLAEGLTLGQAAAELGLSRRTADRRVAAARRQLGARSTTEAIGKAHREGWLA